ncbi:hypothetical protein Q4599_08030 [Cellulophaga lytica]|uniref:hypothetical protein n=1 Tax=Cellulophaga lytica TaxID=979 RepID=UPI0026E25EE7|nr:hypothetical protein [Cellulophaga lytica]MDO6853528.1 hypothetical protein [Cellulophaga lytica]
MKNIILNRIKELGGNIDNVKGKSLQEDLLSITFNTVLYQKPTDSPWAKAEDEEPIYGIGDFIDQNKDLLESDKQSLYDKIIEKYYCLTEEGFGQMFWKAELFTPYKKGTEDFAEWNSDFSDYDEIDLKEIIKLTKNNEPDFIQLFYSYGFPDNLYITLSDPNPENPTLFGTDHEVFFSEVTNEGNLEDLMNYFMTKDELLEIVKNKLEQ